MKIVSVIAELVGLPATEVIGHPGPPPGAIGIMLWRACRLVLLEPCFSSRERSAFSLQRVHKDMADHSLDHVGGTSSSRIGDEVTDRLTPMLASGQLSQVRDVYYLGQIAWRFQPDPEHYLRVSRGGQAELVR
jgi:hypothetical protein